jgi:hypothetical protein
LKHPTNNPSNKWKSRSLVFMVGGFFYLVVMIIMLFVGAITNHK